MSDFNRSGWTAYADEYNAGESASPDKAIDGSTSTYWVTNNTACPHDFWVDMGAAQLVNYITWRNRDWPQDPGNVEVYLSSDGVNWGNPLSWASWLFSNFSAGFNVLVFPAATARWIKIHIISVAPGSGNPVSCADFNAGYDLTKVGTLSAQTPTAPDGTVDVAYSYGIRISQGVTPYTVAVHSGALPAGVTVDNTGLVSGAPTEGGTFTATLRVTDAASTTRDVAISFFIFRSGDPTEGAVITALSMVYWSAFNWTGYEAGETYYIGDNAHPPSYFGGGAGSSFGGGFATAIHTKARGAHSVALVSNPDLGIVVSGGGAIVDVSGSNFWAMEVGTLGADGLNEIFLYGAYFQADYSDGTKSYSYPTAYEVVHLSSNPDTTNVDNPARAIDGSLDTYARVYRSHFSPLGDPCQLRLYGFGEFTATPVPPPLSFKNFAY